MLCFQAWSMVNNDYQMLCWKMKRLYWTIGIHLLAMVPLLAQAIVDNGRLGIGGDPERALHVNSVDISDILIQSYSADGSRTPTVSMQRSRGTANNKLALDQWSRLGFFDFRAFDGALHKDMATIDAYGKVGDNVGENGTGLLRLRVTNGTELIDVMSLDSNRNVGVRTRVPLYTLDIRCDPLTQPGPSGSHWGGLNLFNKAFNDNWTFYPDWFFSTADVLSLYFNNNKIGHFAQSGTWNQTSDARLKQDIRDLEGGQLARINKLRPVTYQMRQNHTDDRKSVGLIAQEVADIYPDLVSGNHAEDGSMMAVNYSALIPYLVKGMQELMIKTQKLKAKKKELEQKIEQIGK